MILVNSGMHWVVPFGVMKFSTGEAAGVLVRDPAWPGMPKFYGLSIFPKKPLIEHHPQPCSCVDKNHHTDEQTGQLHERYFTMEELLSHRGLQGSPDWEGTGAIALVPEDSKAAVFTLTKKSAMALMPLAQAKAQAGQAALSAVKEHGLCGRADSPTQWNDLLKNAQAGEPILVKNPDDPHDDFFLVPLHANHHGKKSTVMAVMDAKTLALREVSLTENWQMPDFSDEKSDAKKISQNHVVLADGTVAKFNEADITANKNHLVWKASAASILPYIPLKEYYAPHPLTGNSTPIYVTPDGAVYGNLSTEEIESVTLKPETLPPSKGSNAMWKFLAGICCGGILAAGVLQIMPQKTKPIVPPMADGTDDDKEINSLRDEINLKDQEIVHLKEAYRKIQHDNQDSIIYLKNENQKILSDQQKAEKKLAELAQRLRELEAINNNLTKAPDPPAPSGGTSIEGVVDDKRDQVAEPKKPRENQ